MLQIYTGNGKGKTTAALGLALRAVGAGKRVAWIAFDKGGETHYSERKVLKERFPEIEFYATGLDRIDPQSGKFRMGVTDQDKTEGEKGLEIFKILLRKAEHDLIILDEINSSCSLGIIKKSLIIEILKNLPKNIELVLTGRDAPQEFLEIADLVTEMKLQKHYFYHGIKAREGFDF